METTQAVEPVKAVVSIPTALHFRDRRQAMPLSPMDFVEFYKNKNSGTLHFYHVDVAKSLKVLPNQNALLRSIANSHMAATFTSISHSMLKSYVNLNITLEAPDLMAAHANVLHAFKFGEVLFENSWSLRKCRAFIKKNKASVVRQCVFLDSILLYLMANRSVEDEEIIGHTRRTKEETEARRSRREEYLSRHAQDNGIYSEIGLPLLKLLSIPDFCMEWYTDGMPFHLQIYFTRHFDESMYNGKPLYAFVASSLLMSVLSLPFADEKQLTVLTKIIEAAKRHESTLDVKALEQIVSEGQRRLAEAGAANDTVGSV